MISGPTIAALEERGLEYVLGVRERTDKRVRETVLDDPKPFTPLLVTRESGAETQLFAREVVADALRYIICRNEAEAEQGRAHRQAIVKGLERQLRQGDKALIGNGAYRRYLRRSAPDDPAAADAPEASPSTFLKLDCSANARQNGRKTLAAIHYQKITVQVGFEWRVTMWMAVNQVFSRM